MDCCDTFKAAPSSWGWVLVANTRLCAGVFFYLETRWLRPADRNLAAAPSSSTAMTQMRSIYPIYAASWLRNAVPECLGFFGISLVPLSIFMNVPAPGFKVKIKRALLLVSFWTWWVQEKNLKLMQAHDKPLVQINAKLSPKLKPTPNCDWQSLHGDLWWFAAWLTTCEHPRLELVVWPCREQSALPILTKTAKARHWRCLCSREEEIRVSHYCVFMSLLIVYVSSSTAALCNLWQW